MAGTNWRADLPLHPHPRTLPPPSAQEILRLLPFAAIRHTSTMMMDDKRLARASLLNAAMADCCFIGGQWPRLSTSPPKRQRHPPSNPINAPAAARDTTTRTYKKREAITALPTAEMAVSLFPGCQWPTLATSAPKRQRQPTRPRMPSHWLLSRSLVKRYRRRRDFMTTRQQYNTIRYVSYYI